MGIGELLFVISMAGGMLGSGVLLGVKTKKWHLMGVFVTFFACFGIWEWISIANTGESISQTIGKFGTDFPILFVVFITMLVVSWGSLMLHFIGMRQKKGK